ncbi:ESYT3 [Symbiodinium natans]|uniref:ESYT3 protein n=1 Tax=Symbiodinium natans TaxID=878477 RepID=A0A812UAG0_9DINO|nr:ESYT3 [Symbiodinium natans]
MARGTKPSPGSPTDLPPSAGSRPTTFSCTFPLDIAAPWPLASIAAKGATNAVELACYWSNSVRPYALRGSPFLRPPVSAALWHFELQLHEGHSGAGNLVIQTALKGHKTRTPVRGLPWFRLVSCWR